MWKRTEAGRKLKRSCIRRPKRFTMRRISAELSTTKILSPVHIISRRKVAPKKKGKKNSKLVKKSSKSSKAKEKTEEKKCSAAKK